MKKKQKTKREIQNLFQFCIYLQFRQHFHDVLLNGVQNCGKIYPNFQLQLNTRGKAEVSSCARPVKRSSDNVFEETRSSLNKLISILNFSNI